MDSLTTPVSVLSAVSSKPKAFSTAAPSMKEFETAAKEFEAVFMTQMLKPMWEGLETDGMFGGGSGEEAMRDFLLQEYGKSMVRSDGYGLSPAIMKEMIRMQEVASGKAMEG